MEERHTGQLTETMAGREEETEGQQESGIATLTVRVTGSPRFPGEARNVDGDVKFPDF